MQGVRIEREVAVARRDAQLLVAVVEQVRRRGHAALLDESGPDGRTGAVGADHDPRRRDHLPVRRLERQCSGHRIERDQPVLEHHLHARCGLGRVEQGVVEVAAADRVDRPLPVGAVGLEVERAVDRVDHAAGHRNRAGHHGRLQPDAPEGVETALGDREVDRPAALDLAIARIAATLVHRHQHSAPGQEARQQAAGEAGADDRHVFVVGHVPIDSRSARAARQQSWYVEYSGTGARRTMSGSRSSAITPWSSRSSLASFLASCDADRELRTAASGIAGRDGREGSGDGDLVEQRLEIRGQPNAPRPQCLHPDPVEQLERRAHRTHREDRRVRDLPGLRGGRRPRGGRHLEAGRRVGAPPALEARDVVATEVALVDEHAGKRPRPRVQVLVRAPRSEVDVPLVQMERHVAGGVSEIPADVGAAGSPGGSDRGDVEQLAGEVVDRAEEHERDDRRTRRAGRRRHRCAACPRHRAAGGAPPRRQGRNRESAPGCAPRSCRTGRRCPRSRSGTAQRVGR